MTFEITSGVVKQPQKILLYGTPGIGKTQLCSQNPDTLFLDLESGSLNFDVSRILGITKFNDYVKAVMEFASNEKYKTLVVDSLTKIEAMVTNQLLEEKGWDSLEKPGYGKGYEELKQRFMRVIAGCDYLVSKGKNVIIVAHCVVKPFMDPSGEQYDRYQPDCQKQILPILLSQMDSIFFYQWRKITVEAEKGDRYIAKGSGDRELFTQERPAFIAKSRQVMEVSYLNPKKEFWTCL